MTQHPPDDGRPPGLRDLAPPSWPAPPPTPPPAWPPAWPPAPTPAPAPRPGPTWPAAASPHAHPVPTYAPPSGHPPLGPPAGRARHRRAASLISVGLVVAAGVAALDIVVGSRPDRAALELDAAQVGAELDAWWATELRGRDRGFLPVRDRITDGDDGMTCFGEPVVIDDDLYDNAWVAWCDEGLTVAYDPWLFGDDPVALRVVLAHEWGHVVQYVHLDLDELTAEDDGDDPAEGELQADCYAGAWVGDNLTDEEVVAAVAVVRRLGDEAGTSADDVDGHGTSSERVAAFTRGVDGGVDACFPDAFEPR